MFWPRRHVLLRSAPPVRSARVYHPDPYRVGQLLRAREDIVVIHASLPFHQPRVRAGSLVRVLRPISDPTVEETYYRFELLDQQERRTGWWSLAGASQLEAAEGQSLGLRARVRRWLRRWKA